VQINWYWWWHNIESMYLVFSFFPLYPHSRVPIRREDMEMCKEPSLCFGLKLVCTLYLLLFPIFESCTTTTISIKHTLYVCMYKS
jgi:hypothetical protein